MKVERISLKNFKQYEDISIDLSTSNEKNVTIIYGVMGAGKTGLFQAFSWCLYGSTIEMSSFKNNQNGYGSSSKPFLIANKGKIQNLNKGDALEVSVSMTFIDNFKRYIATRVITYKKINEKSIEQINEKFDITISTPTGEPELIIDEDRKIRIINSILPQTIRDYFLFDGEKIDRFSQLGQEDEIKDAIYQVLGLYNFELVGKLLVNSKRAYLDDIKKIGVEDKDLVEGIEIINEIDLSLNKQKELKKSNKEELEAAASYLSKIDDDLAKFEGKKELIEKRKNVEDKKSQILKDISKYEEKNIKYISESRSILGTSALKEALDVIQELRKKKQIPSYYSERLIKDIIDDGTCICGRSVENGSPEHETLKKILEQSILFSTDKQNKIIDLYGEINKLESKNKINIIQFKEHFAEIDRLKTELGNVQDSLNEVNKLIDAFDEEEFNNLNQKRHKTLMDIEGLKSKIAVNTAEVERLTQELKDAQEDLQTAKTGNVKVKEIKDKLLFIENLQKAINSLYTTYADDKRKQIDDMCKQVFKKLIWKNSQFKNVELNEKYELNVLDRFNYPARPDLSAGERQLLSLAFITAMAYSAGKEAPFILDTPFARISKVPRENIAKYLPELVSQLILFVTDVEIIAESEVIFNKKAGKIYTIIFDDELGMSHIMEGKHV